jgi:hypothetical protein
MVHLRGLKSDYCCPWKSGDNWLLFSIFGAKKQMMRFSLFCIIILALTIGACTSEKIASRPYNKHGVRFEIPEGWLEKEMPIPNEGNYIMVEKQGENPENESGQFIVSILDKIVPLNAYMELMRQQLTQQMTMMKNEIQFTETELTEFAGQEALKAHFKFEQSGQSYRGVLQTFLCGEKTIYLFVQEAEEDASRNVKGFDILRNSLACVE